MDPLESAEDEWAQVAEIVPTFKDKSAEGDDTGGGGQQMPQAQQEPINPVNVQQMSNVAQINAQGHYGQATQQQQQQMILLQQFGVPNAQI